MGVSLSIAGGYAPTRLAVMAVHPRIAVLFALLLTVSSLPAAAQDAPEQPDQEQTPAGPVITPPKLVRFVEATYPPEALKQGLAARVEIELIVTTEGTVQDPVVVTPAGNGFDEAALEAVSKFEFEPATRDGEPIPAKIRYPYVFEMQREVEPTPEPEQPAPARFEGRAIALEDDSPLGAVKVTFTSDDGERVLETVTGADGKFSFEEVQPGNYWVRLSLAGRVEIAEEESLVSGQVTEVVYRMEEPPDDEAFGAVARVPPPPREVTRRSIGKQQLTRIPGTRGDALRTVELMPGVSRPAFGTGALIVRGSSPQDSQAMFEGLPIPLLYHFGGLTSFINSRLLDGIEFYPGNFSARYGRRRGGIVEVQAKDPADDALHGVLDVNLIDASLLVESPLTDDWEFAGAVRRSYVDLIFESVLDSEDINTIAAPVYYDYQTITTYRPSERDKLRLMVFGSRDEFKLLFSDPPDTDASVSGDFDFATEFHRAHATWSRQLSDDVDQDINLAVGAIDLTFGLGDAFQFALTGTEIYGRSEWRGRVTDKVRLIGGLDVFAIPGDFTYRGPPIGQAEGNPEQGPNGSAFSESTEISATNDFTVFQPGGYIESDLNLDPARIVLGTRVDYFDDVDEYTFDPRVSGHYAVTDSTRIKAGVGLFSQPPQYQESDPDLGNSDLEVPRSVHLGTGVDQDITDEFFVSIDGFYKHLFDRVVATEFGDEPFFTNDGIGRVYGLELSARVEPKGRFFGYLSYTLSRSERRDRDGDWRLFDFDQPHILTLSGVYRLGAGWEAGATFRLVSGNPSTPIVGSSYNATTGQYVPIFGPINSRRNPTFNRLDVRVEKMWTFDAWKLAVYLDVQNVYNAKNPEGTVYDFEYREKEEITGLPILPNLGIRGEM